MVAEAHVVLEEWRRAEPVLTLLPTETPERDEVRKQVELLRALYQRLTATADGVGVRLTASRNTIDKSIQLLDRVTDRYALDPAAQIADEA